MLKHWAVWADRVGRVALGAALCLALVSSASAAVPPEIGEPKVQVEQTTDTTAPIAFAVTPGDGKDLSVAVCYGEQDWGRHLADWPQKIDALEPTETDKSGNKFYAAELTDLEPKKTYFFRVVATTSEGTTWSSKVQFKTRNPIVPLHIRAARGFGWLAVIIAPFFVGGFLAKRWRMPDHGWKFGLALCALCVGAAITGFGWPPKLGIDLSGGVVLVYELADDEQLAEPDEAAVAPKDGKEEKADEAEKKAKENLSEKQRQDIEDKQSAEVMDKLIRAIEMRVNAGGVLEIPIRRYGSRQIEVTIPMANPAEVRRVKEKISQAGTLVFRILGNVMDHPNEVALAKQTPGDKVKDGDRLIGLWVPVAPGEEDSFLRMDADKINNKIAVRQGIQDGRSVLEVFVVLDEYNITGDFLANARPGNDSDGSPCVLFLFNREGSDLFSELTGENLPESKGGFTRKLGIILNDKLFTAPQIQSRIDGNGQITGGFTQERVQDLVDVLNAGSLPAKLKDTPISQLSIGPRLGQDMIQRGVLSLGLAVAIVCVFMAVYYRFAGVVACLAMLMNLLLTVSVMILINADFTLPGLAGLVLTIGMSVDANVLINERMREELAKGVSLRMAIRNGFGRAMSAIIDSNVTTVLTGVILYIIGTPLIKGFAIVLVLGVLLNMYTAVVCARLVFDVAERRRWLTTLRMRQVIGHTNIDFVGMRYIGYGLSAVVMLIGLAAVVSRGKGLLDIDFTGGVSAVVLFEKPHEIEAVRKALDDGELMPDLTVANANLTEEPVGYRYMINTSREVREDVEAEKNKSSIELVEDRIENVFGEELARNHLTFGPITKIATPAPEAEPTPANAKTSMPALPTEPKANPADAKDGKKDAAPGKNATPGKTDQSRADLGPALWAAGWNPATLLAADDDAAKATSAGKAEEKAAENKAAKASSAEPSTEAKEPLPGKKPEAADTPKLDESDVSMVDLLAGGSQVELTLSQGMDHDTLKAAIDAQLSKTGLDVPYELVPPTDASAGETGGEGAQKWVLRIQLDEKELKDGLLTPLAAEFESRPYFPSSSNIGGTVATDMQIKAVTALIASMVCITLYLWIRFQQVVFGLAAVIALIHDIFITLGALAISAYVAPFLGFLLVDPFKIGLTVLAAFLTVVGYSLNDTIIVFDRIREVRGKSPVLTAAMINLSVNQTLSRTVLTALTTLLAILILYIFAGAGIHGFAFTMLVGVVTGTFSSVFIASPILYWYWNRVLRANGGSAK